MFSERTTYSILDECNNKSSISLNKFDADVLQKTIQNVHYLVQKTYNYVYKHYPKLSRRKRGNLVRYFIYCKAAKKPLYHIMLDELL